LQQIAVPALPNGHRNCDNNSSNLVSIFCFCLTIVANDDDNA